MASLAALVPVKQFAAGKSRLGSALTEAERGELARELATAVVTACGPLPVFVACEDDAVAAWARSLDATPLRSDRAGLNRVVRHGVAHLAAQGFARVLVAHADLADPRSLPDLVRWDGVVLVPDRRLDGTNVLIVPTGERFGFSYGPGSFARHLSEAERLGTAIHVIDDAGLALDLDEPADLEAYRSTVGAGLRSTPRER